MRILLKKIKIKYILFTLILFTVSVAVGCGNANINPVTGSVLTEKDRKTIVCSIFPGFDWVRNITGQDSDVFDVYYLLNNGQDIHSYQPSARDIAIISDADVVVCVGGPSDQWINQVLLHPTNENQKVISMMQVLDGVVKEEEIVEGMQSREEHEHEHEEADAQNENDMWKENMTEAQDKEESCDEAKANRFEETEEFEEPEYDEHVWMSAENAILVCQQITDVLCSMDQENKEVYIRNSDSYIELLNQYVKDTSERVSELQKKTIIVADRFPFRYFTDEFGINYYAAFPGCSSESDSSFETVVFLIEKVREYQVNHLFVMENSNRELASTITDYCNIQEIYELNSMQSVTTEDIENGISYLGIMEENADNLIEGLR